MDIDSIVQQSPLRALLDFSARNGIELDAAAVERFLTYRELLFAANRSFNLTRITDPTDFEFKVLIDSVILLPYVPASAERLLDVGSGGGVPGLVLASSRPDLAVTLLDATAKKVNFLRDTAATLGLVHVAAVQGRAEELGHAPNHRETYDVVTARAVARLATLVELTLPFVRVGGTAILPKGLAAHDELREAAYAIERLGGRSRPIRPRRSTARI